MQQVEDSQEDVCVVESVIFYSLSSVMTVIIIIQWVEFSPSELTAPSLLRDRSH